VEEVVLITVKDLVPGAVLSHPSVKWRLPGTVVAVMDREGEPGAWTLIVLPLVNQSASKSVWFELGIGVEDLDMMERLDRP